SGALGPREAENARRVFSSHQSIRSERGVGAPRSGGCPPSILGGSKLERETGSEPATSTLARSHSTTELFPPVGITVRLKADTTYCMEPEASSRQRRTLSHRR